jgi:hypothetical protein
MTVSALRAWLSCALIVLSAAFLLVGLLLLESEPEGSLALVVGPSVVLAALGALTAPRGRGS